MKNRWMSLLTLALILFVFPIAVSAMDYPQKLEAKDMDFSWRIDGDQIHIKLSAKTTGWVAIGFDPEKDMQGANIIIGAVKKGKFKVEDHYGDRRRGHSSDKELGGNNDVMNASGSEVDGITTISFSIPLDTGDKYDKPVTPDKMTKIMLGYGSGKDSFRTRHPYRAVYEVNLMTGEREEIK